MSKSKSAPQIFLSYAREDRELVENLYQRLLVAGFKPWMDTKDILPGEIWMDRIRHAIQQSDFFLACLSANSVSKRGVLQKEFKSALDSWQGMLDNDIYFIPVRLEDCLVPESMGNFQWVDLFEKNGFSRLEKAIKRGMELRSKSITPVVQRPARLVEQNNDQKQGNKNIEMRSVYPRRGILRATGIILGLLLVVAGIPWVYNNYFFHVEQPTVPLTCQVSSKPVHVGVARISNCSPAFQNQLVGNLSGEAVEITEIAQAFSTSDEAGKQAGYDIVIWGVCDDAPGTSEKASLIFELTTSRKPYEVFEISALRATGTLAELTAVGDALFSYQYGDYRNAAAAFNALPAASNSVDFALFKANSWLFAEQYEKAINSYKEIIRNLDPDSAEAYNNLGVALLNTERPAPESPFNYQGLDEFSQAVKLASDRHQTDIELLAYVNRSYVYRQGNSWVNALNDCNAALRLDAQSALPHLCLASYYFSYYNKPERFGLLPLGEINQYLSEAEASNDVPALAHHMRAVWHLEHFWMQKQEAMDAYMLFFVSMENRACLRKDYARIDEAKRTIRIKLTDP